jgi:hypothetical protein
MKAAVLCAALLVAQQISIDVDLVVFNVAVLDSKARPVKGLSKGKHQAFEDGKEQAIQFVPKIFLLPLASLSTTAAACEGNERRWCKPRRSLPS